MKTDDERVKSLLRGERPTGISAKEFSSLRDGLHALDAVARLEDTLYVGLRIDEAVKVGLVHLRRSTTGAGLGR